LTGYVQAFGLVGRSIRVQLVSSAEPSGGPNGKPDQVLEDERSVRLPPDGELLAVRFEVTPSQAGVRTFTVRVDPPGQDGDARDNERSANVQVVERKNRVLLFAGGPTREFQFLRNMLFRDKDTTLHVLLQSGTPGISQESDELLFEFPSLVEELFEYDCIVAFDPD
jgi:hypothetical protein